MKRRLITVLFCLCIIFSQMAPTSHAIRTTVRVGFCSGMAPYQYLAEDGTPTGLYLELLENIAERSNLVTELIPYDSTTMAMDALQKGDIDLVLGVPETQYMDYNVMFSDIISTASLCLIVPNGAAENRGEEYLENSIIGVEYRLVNYNFFLHAGRNLMLQANQKSTIDILRSNGVEAVVANKDCALYYLQEVDLMDDYEILNNHIATIEYKIAIHNSDWYLRQVIDNCLKELRITGTYSQLYDEWILPTGNVDYVRIIRIASIIVSVVLIFSGSYLIASYRTKKDLTRRVQEQTAALSAANMELNQRALQAEAESKLRNTILESSSAGMVMISQHQTIEYMNAVAMKMVGVSSYQVGDQIKENSVLRKIIAALDQSGDLQNWPSNEQTIKIPETGSKASRQYRYNIHKVNNVNDEPSILISVEDVTVEERERAAFFEREKNKTLNGLIAGIAHEIRNPLTAIRTSAEMMESKGNNEKFRAAFSQYIPQEIARITRLIDNLLDYARPGKSKIEAVSLRETVPVVYELAKMSAKDVDITLYMDQSDELVFVGDRDKIKQALFNIVLNSIEAVRHKVSTRGDAQGIDIRVEERTDAVCIQIRDDGMGMSEEELEHCTEPFYTTKLAGTGIGLAYTKQYIEEVGGILTIDSRKNEYTCVEMQLPKGLKEGGN